MKRILLALAAVLCIAPSCTIHEERAGCPCSLTIFAFKSTIGTPHRDLRLLLYAEDTELCDEDITIKDENSKVVFSVPKSDIQVFSVSGLERSSIRNGTVRIPKGVQSDSIFAYSRILDSRCELASDTLRLKKQFTTLEVQIDGDIPSEDLQMMLVGNSCGFAENGLQAIQGHFEAELEPIRENVYRARIPRQCDSGLSLKIFRGKERLRDYAVGKLLSEAGIDWSKPSLDDVYMSVDLSKSNFFISISDWETGLKTDISM